MGVGLAAEHPVIAMTRPIATAITAGTRRRRLITTEPRCSQLFPRCRRRTAVAEPARRKAWSKSSPVSGRDSRLSGKDRRLRGLGQHHAQYLLQGEDVNARTPALEEVASAVPGFAFESNRVRIVVALKRDRELFERDPIQLAGVAVRLLDLPDERAVHRRYPSVALHCPEEFTALPRGRGGGQLDTHCTAASQERPGGSRAPCGHLPKGPARQPVAAELRRDPESGAADDGLSDRQIRIYRGQRGGLRVDPHERLRAAETDQQP